jgi:hypothetical protein
MFFFFDPPLAERIKKNNREKGIWGRGALYGGRIPML